MYKVFINEHLIQIKDIADFNPFESDEISMFKIVKEDVISLVKYLLKEQREQIVSLYFENLKEGFEEFKDSFNLIQAAGGKVENLNGEILFIYRLKKWDLPKGKIEKGENSEEAALREVEEECGISNLQLKNKLKDTWHIYFHKERYCLKQTFWYSMSYDGAEELIPQKEEGIDEVVWANSSKLQTFLCNTYLSIKELF